MPVSKIVAHFECDFVGYTPKATKLKQLWICEMLLGNDLIKNLKKMKGTTKDTQCSLPHHLH